MRVAIVIPAYNEAATIRSIAESALRQSPLVVVVDDGSTDGTAAAVSGIPVRLVTHADNRGKAAALWNGFAVALGEDVDYVATLDGDGQHLPQDVSRLLAATRDHPRSIIVGARLHDRAAAPLVRRFANRFADFWISWAAGYPIADSQSGERLYPAELLRAVQVRHDPRASFTLESEILIRGARLGFASVAVAIPTIYATGARRSHFRPVRDVARIAAMVAREIVGRRFYLKGLWQSLRRRPTIAEALGSVEMETPEWRRI